MRIMEPPVFARMLGSLQAGIPKATGKEPDEKETDISYARTVVGRAVKAFSKIRDGEDFGETAKTVRLITQPLLEDLHQAQARINEKSAVLDKTAVVLTIVAGQLQLTAIEYEAAFRKYTEPK